MTCQILVDGAKHLDPAGLHVHMQGQAHQSHERGCDRSTAVSCVSLAWICLTCSHGLTERLARSARRTAQHAPGLGRYSSMARLRMTAGQSTARTQRRKVQLDGTVAHGLGQGPPPGVHAHEHSEVGMRPQHARQAAHAARLVQQQAALRLQQAVQPVQPWQQSARGRDPSPAL